MRGLNWGAVTLLLLGACGPPPKPVIDRDDKPPPPDPFAGEDQYVDVAKARAYIAKAEKVLTEDKDFDAARKILTDGERFANDTVREDIRRMKQKIDNIEAHRHVPGIVKLAKAGKCDQAVKASAKVRRDTHGNAVHVFVRQETSKAILDCLLGALDIDVSIGRELAENQELKHVLEPVHHQELMTRVDEATVGTIVAELKEPIAKREWAKVVKQLDELVARKEAGEREVARIMGVVRKGVAADVLAIAAEALESAVGAGAALAKAEALIAAARWKQPGEIRGVAMPDKVAARRRQLTFWALCSKLGCKLTEPTVNWAYGDAEIRPLTDTGGKVQAKVKHAAKLWRVAESSGWILVVQKDPGSLAEGVEARVRAAGGWVASSQIKASDTAEMLPPGDALVGTRVWGPFRTGQSTWELGFVRQAKGNDLEVERIADGQKVKGKRSEVRFGKVVGVKILTMCSGNFPNEEAVVDQEVATSKTDAVVKVSCLEDGKPGSLKRQVVLGSLRTKPAWLPPRR